MVLFVLFLILMVVGLALLIEAADKQRLASVRRRLRTAALVSLALFADGDRALFDPLLAGVGQKRLGDFWLECANRFVMLEG
jgi:hypothetical protein